MIKCFYQLPLLSDLLQMPVLIEADVAALFPFVLAAGELVAQARQLVTSEPTFEIKFVKRLD